MLLSVDYVTDDDGLPSTLQNQLLTEEDGFAIRKWTPNQKQSPETDPCPLRAIELLEKEGWNKDTGDHEKAPSNEERIQKEETRTISSDK